MTPLTAEAQGQVGPGDDVAGIQANRLAQLHFGVGVSPLPAEGNAEIQMMIGVVGVEPDGFAEGRLGVRLEALSLEGRAEISVEMRRAGPERDGARARLRLHLPVGLAPGHRGEADP